MIRNRALAMAAVLAVTAAPALAQPDPAPTRRGDAKPPTSPTGAGTPATGGTPAGGAAGGTASGPVYNCVKNPKGVTVSFGKTELELQDLLDWAMTFSCKNFIYQAGIAGRTSKVVLMSPKKLSPGEAWEVFLAALNTMGLAVVDKGATLKIVESTEIKKQPLPIRRGGVGNDDQMVRAIIRPQHVTADDLAAALNAMTSKDGLVTTLPKANLVLVTDYASHITPMRSLVRDLDKAQTGDGLYVIKLQYADVTEVAQTVNDLLGVRAAGSAPASSGGAPPPRRRGDDAAGGTPSASFSSGEEISVAVPTKVIAETRTNSLIILASEAAYLRVRALVKALDVPVAVEGGGRIHVYYLENADAEELGTTMTSVISGITQPSGGAPAGGNRRPAPAAPGAPAGAGSNEGPAFEGQVRVTHDKPTNSLVVVASVKDFLAVREVIRKLDIPRRQVFIEAVILEVSANMARDLGFSWHGGTTLDDGAIAIGGLQHTQLRSLNVATLATSTGLLGGVIGPLLEGAEELLGTSIPSFGILFQALATNSNVNVLSSPHILTTDNEPAEISVGQNIPYQSSVSNFGQGGGTGGQTPGFGFPLQSIQRQDVALTLKITPHINASDMVRMEIDQEISDIADPDFNGNGPSWSKRTIKTTVVARDQQSIVLGGLMADRQTRNESKIPLLGDIPILGYLFKYEQTTKTKTNLLILLTPYVIKDQMDIEELVQRKVRERQEFVRAFSNFRRMGYRSGIDYRRKRGLLAEINHVVTEIEVEAALLKELERKDEQFPDGRIEYDTEPPDETDDDTPAPPPPAPAPAAPAPTSPPGPRP